MLAASAGPDAAPGRASTSRPGGTAIRSTALPARRASRHAHAAVIESADDVGRGAVRGQSPQQFASLQHSVMTRT